MPASTASMRRDARRRRSPRPHAGPTAVPGSSSWPISPRPCGRRWPSRRCGASMAIGAVRGPRRMRTFLLDRAQDHGLLVGAEFADFVEEKHATVRRAQQAAAILDRPGEGAAAMAKQRRHGPVAAQRRAVDLDEAAGHLLTAALQLVDPACETGLASAGRPAQQDRSPRADRDLLDIVDQAVEGGVAGPDAGLQERGVRGPFRPGAGRDRIVF